MWIFSCKKKKNVEKKMYDWSKANKFKQFKDYLINKVNEIIRNYF